MAKILKLEDLTPEQLRAQVKLCFKMFKQCLDLLNGEDIPDQAAIKLVDPFGDSDDMELFYTCKRIGGGGDLSDALETIDKLNKRVEKLQKRLAKKHDELEQTKSELARKDCELNRHLGRIRFKVEFDVDSFVEMTKEVAKILRKVGDLSAMEVQGMPEAAKQAYQKLWRDFVEIVPKAMAKAVADKSFEVGKENIPNNSVNGVSEKTAKELEDRFKAFRLDTFNLRRHLAQFPLHLDAIDAFAMPIIMNPDHIYQLNNPKPGFSVGDKVFFMNGNVVKSGIVKKIWKYDCGFSYLVVNKDGDVRYKEEEIFPSVEKLLENLKKKFNG